jgi:hypothetical protein
MTFVDRSGGRVDQTTTNSIPLSSIPSRCLPFHLVVFHSISCAYDFVTSISCSSACDFVSYISCHSARDYWVLSKEVVVQIEKELEALEKRVAEAIAAGSSPVIKATKAFVPEEPTSEDKNGGQGSRGYHDGGSRGLYCCSS